MEKKTPASNTEKSFFQKYKYALIIGISILITAFATLFFWTTGPSDTEVTIPEQDAYMTTNSYNVDIIMGADAGYDIQETIDVSFSTPRHGIYRYVSSPSYIQYHKGEKTLRIPCLTNIKLNDSNTDYDISYSDDFQIYQFGSADKIITAQTYDFSYRISSRFDDEDYHLAYCNIYGNQWKDVIPAGSTFSITFPNGYEKDHMQFYYTDPKTQKGTDASDFLELTYEENRIHGVLKKDLSLGSGLTFYEEMPAGYFTQLKTIKEEIQNTYLDMAFLLFCVIILYVIFGIKRPIIRSIQYAAPEGMDSACVGYIMDEKVDNKDIFSLLIYWADKNIVSFSQKKKELWVTKKARLPEDAPDYQKQFYQLVFAKSGSVNISSLKNISSKNYLEVKDSLKQNFTRKNHSAIKSTLSKIAHIISCILIFLIVFLFLFTGIGIGSLAVSIFFYIGFFLLGRLQKKWNTISKEDRIFKITVILLLYFLPLIFMIFTQWSAVSKGMELNYMMVSCVSALELFVASLFAASTWRYTKKATQWMGWLLGIRDFIEVAELDRIKAMGEEHPEWFFHILPYVYVMGLTDTWVHRLNQISIGTPDWYAQENNGSFSPAFFSDTFTRDMNKIDTQIRNYETSYSSSSTSGGSFSSGGSSDSSSGDSGGGFGGGGGGSW